MSAQDLELNSGVRSVLSRHWIDLTKTSFFARNGHVHLGGEVRVLGEPRGSTADALKSTEAELRRLRDVKTVSFGFKNWVRDGAGSWVCLDKDGEERGSGPTTGGSSGNEVYEIDWRGNEVKPAARGGSS
jgi:hypothetical protein